jgi:high affinity Mn2+ porin
MRGLACIAILCASPALAADLPESALEVRGQATYIRQYKPSFPAAYSGLHSLDVERAWSYTLTGTLFFGARLSDATELYFNPEFVQGLAFSRLLGTGGFTNGEIQRTTGQQLRGRGFSRVTPGTLVARSRRRSRT